MPKPSDFFVSVVDFFAVLLPGAVLTALLVAWAVRDREGPDLVNAVDTLGMSSFARWAALAVAAYVVGHVLVALGSLILDPTYDYVYKGWWKQGKPLPRMILRCRR